MSDDLLEVLAQLADDAGAAVYVVGGYLRDRLLEREPVDLDLLVEGAPASFLQALSRRADFEPVVFSRKEPITYRVAMADWLIDVSSCRPGGLVEALRRRDFTINALAAPLGRPGEPHPGVTLDPLGGLDDLRSGRIRHISTEALEEDPVRLMRAVRLATVLEGFSLDPSLHEDIRARAHLIAGAPPERLLAELEVVLSSPKAGTGLRLMGTLDLLFHVLPELKPLDGLAQSRWHKFDALEHTLRCVEEADILQSGSPAIMIDARLGMEDAEVLKWSALHHDTGKAGTASLGEDGEVHFYGHEILSSQLAAAALTRLRVSQRKIERVRKLVESHLRLTLLAEGETSEKALRRLIHQLRYDTPLLCLLALADRRAGGGERFEERLARLERLAARVMALFETEGERVISPSPLLTGHEVMEILGLRPGPRVGLVMRWLTRLQVEEKLTLRDDAVALLRSLPASRILTLDDEP